MVIRDAYSNSDSAPCWLRIRLGFIWSLFSTLFIPLFIFAYLVYTLISSSNCSTNSHPSFNCAIINWGLSKAASTIFYSSSIFLLYIFSDHCTVPRMTSYVLIQKTIAYPHADINSSGSNSSNHYNPNFSLTRILSNIPLQL